MSRSNLHPIAFECEIFYKVYFLKTVEAKFIFSLDTFNIMGQGYQESSKGQA